MNNRTLSDSGQLEVAIVPHRLTLRVCHDLDWKVYAHCTPCRTMTALFTSHSEAKRPAALPIGALLERGVLKCRKCNTPTDSLSISRSLVGISVTVAEWQVYTLDGKRAARLVPSQVPSRRPAAG